MKITAEQIIKAQSAKSPEELIALAKEENIELTPETADEYYAKLVPPSGELDDDELDFVSGGGCGSSDSAPAAPADFGYSNGQRVYHSGGMCSNCPSRGYPNPSRNFVFEWVDQPGGYFKLTCEICKETTQISKYNGDPSARGIIKV